MFYEYSEELVCLSQLVCAAWDEEDEGEGPPHLHDFPRPRGQGRAQAEIGRGAEGPEWKSKFLVCELAVKTKTTETRQQQLTEIMNHKVLVKWKYEN